MSIRNQAREVVLKIKRKDTSPHVVADYKSFEATETFALHKVSKEAEAREAEDIEINSKIPDAASALNKLADHDWVVELVNSESAYYITSNAAGDAFATREALESAEEYWSGGEPRTPTRNDYAVVQDYEGTQWRFIYAVPRVTTEVSDTESDSESSEVPTGHWEPQYPIETNDYDGLSNKPSINGVELIGDKSAAELGIELDRIVSPNGKTVVVVKDEGKAALEKKITEQCTGWVITKNDTGAEIATLTDSSSEIQEGYLVEKWTGKDTEGHDVTLSFIWQGDAFMGGSVRVSPYTYARIDAFTDDTHTEFHAYVFSGVKKQVEVIRWESATILTEDDNITELVSPDGNTVVSADNDGTAKVAHTTTSFGNATVHFPDGFSITADSMSYTAPSGGESIEFYGPIESSLFPSDRFWVPYEYKDTSDFDPNQAVWCLTTARSSLEVPIELMFKAGPFFSVSDWDSAAPTLTLGMGETTGELPTMTRALTPSTVTKTVATTDQIPEVPAVVPPSTSATTGQAADAKATGEALSLNAVEPSAWSVSPEYTYAVVVNYEGSSLGWMFGFQHPHPQPTDWVSANNTDPDATLLQCEYGGTTYTATVKGGYRLGPDSTSNPNRDKMLASQADMATLRNRVSDIERVIPSDASSDNQLADKSYVNTAVATSSATFLGTSEAATKAEFETWLETLHADNNDYVFWQTVNSEGNTVYKRYKYSDFDDSSEGYSGPLPSSDFPITWDGGRVDLADADTLIWGTWGDGGKVLKTADELVICYFDADGLCRLRPDQVIRDLAFAGSPAIDGEWPVLDEDGSDSSDEPLAGHWLFEYELNNPSFTPEQWDAINSGIVGVVDPSPDALPGQAASAAGTAEATTLKARWVIVEGVLPEGLQISVRYSEAAGEWVLTVTAPDGAVIGEFSNTGGEGPDAASVTFDTREFGTLVVSRRGLILGSQSETPIASEAEAEALRTAVAGKADNTDVVHKTGNEEMTGPLFMVGTSVRLQSSNKKTTVAFSYASITHTVYGSSSMTWGYPKSSGTLALTAGTGHNGNLAALDAQGNPMDSGKSFEDIQDQIDTESPLLARSYAVSPQSGWTVNQGSSSSPIYFRPRYFGMKDGDLFKGIILRTRSTGLTPFPSGVYMRVKRYSDGQTIGVSELTVWPNTASTDVVFRFSRAVELTSSGNYYMLDFSATPTGSAVNFGMALYSLPSGSTNPDFYFASSTNVPIATAQFYSWEELTGADIAVSGTDATKISAALADKLDTSGGTMTGDISFSSDISHFLIILGNGFSLYRDGNEVGVYNSGNDDFMLFPKGKTGCFCLLDVDIAPYFDSSSTYAVDSLVVYGYRLYRCSTAVTTAGAWTGSTNWTTATVEDVLAALRTAIANKQDAITPAEITTQVGITSVNAAIKNGQVITPVQIPTSAGLSLLLADKVDNAAIAPEFSTASTYAVDDVVMHEGARYRCTTAVSTAGAWNAANWTTESVESVIGDIESVLHTINNGAQS